MDFEKAFMRPFQDGKKLALGILLSLFPIINLLALGYLAKSTHLVLKKRKAFALPEWDDWGNLFLHGLAAALIGIAWSLLVVLVIVAMGGTLIFSLLLGRATLSSVFAALVNAGLLVAAVPAVLFLAVYMLPASFVEYAREYRLRDAFRIKTLARISFRKEYFAAWFVGGIYITAASLMLRWIPLLGASVASFVASMTALTLLAEIRRDFQSE
ncbi:DUF4013 domain-containing protein [Candidatus Woesearchaeota archaeon]|nr:MAG: DUF4013 domain-containing protein [Candidatus Woesearchaeota archaeon]